MALSYLTVPNNYDLFCNSITPNVPVTPGVGAENFLIENVVPVIGGSIVLSYSVRGGPGILPVTLPYIVFGICQGPPTSTYKVVTVLIPQFTILTMSGAAAPDFTLPLLPLLTPVFNITVPLLVKKNNTTTIVGQCLIKDNSTMVISPVAPGVFDPTDYGLVSDVSFSYNLYLA